MRLRLVRPMVQKGSFIPHLAKRIPLDIEARLVGRTLVIPLGEETASFTVAQSRQSVRYSLRTADPVAAKVRHADAVAYLEQYFEAMRRGRPLELSHRQITALGGEFYRGWSKGPDGMVTSTFSSATGHVSQGPDTDEEEAELLAAVGQQLAEKAEEGGEEYLLRTYALLWTVCWRSGRSRDNGDKLGEACSCLWRVPL